MNSNIKITFVFSLILFFNCTLLVKNKVPSDTKGAFSFEIVKLGRFFDGRGAIVPEHYIDIMFATAAEGRFTPNIKQIKEAEEIFLHEFAKYYEENSEKLILRRSELRKYNRQYVGYNNSKGDPVIILFLMNFSSSEARREFSGWEKNIIMKMDDEFWLKNTRLVEINLRARRFEGDANSYLW